MSDIENFWRTYDLASKEPDRDKRIAIYQSQYLDKGSQGLKEFAALRIGKARDLAAKIESMPKYYASIRQCSLRVSTMLPKIRASFLELKRIYPDAEFPDVYFVIGRLSSGGTTWRSGLLIGTEMSCLTNEAAPEEFSDWHKEVLKPLEKLPAIVAHELVHIQQKISPKGDLLSQSLNEGGADLVGGMISGMSINENLYRYGIENEAKLWLEFAADMDTSTFDSWLYNGGKIKGRPADLGYFVGYKICEAYYRNSTDKRRAIADILNISEPKKFLKESKYLVGGKPNA
ncbi:MAG: DUF2268 domain-containing putative Zn-dependent protease [Pyrinomonadaceae bacterium]